jgi:hypothetical protein
LFIAVNPPTHRRLHQALFALLAALLFCASSATALYHLLKDHGSNGAQVLEGKPQSDSVCKLCVGLSASAGAAPSECLPQLTADLAESTRFALTAAIAVTAPLAAYLSRAPPYFS